MTDSVQLFKFCAEIPLQRGAVANVWTMFILEAPQFRDQRFFKVAFGRDHHHFDACPSALDCDRMLCVSFTISSQPAGLTAGRMNFVQRSRSVKLSLSIAADGGFPFWPVHSATPIDPTTQRARRAKTRFAGLGPPRRVPAKIAPGTTGSGSAGR